MDAEHSSIERVLAALPVGIVLERVEPGVGTFFTMHFWAPEDDRRETPSIRVWVYFSEWFLLQGDEVLSTFQDGFEGFPYGLGGPSRVEASKLWNARRG